MWRYFMAACMEKVLRGWHPQSNAKREEPRNRFAGYYNKKSPCGGKTAGAVVFLKLWLGLA